MSRRPSEDRPMQRVMIELPDDVAQQVGPYQDRLRELVLLGLRQSWPRRRCSSIARGWSPSRGQPNWPIYLGRR